MARVEAGALQAQRRAGRPDRCGRRRGRTIRARALEGHAIRLDVPPDLPLVRVDPQLLHHCLINLLDNAGRYADPGTPIIDPRPSARSAQLALSVLDEGPGLPPGREREVFETFRRLEGSDRAKGGTGLGLAIVKGVRRGDGA